jgi:DNA-directed RNA polymerase specialized sigma24 family protein
VNATGDKAKGPVRPERLAWLLERHAPALELYARQFCRCADDVVQEAVIELAARAQAPDDDVAWLYGVVRLRYLRWRRCPTSSAKS